MLRHERISVPRIKKRDVYKKEDGYEQCLQMQVQQNYLITNVNKVCGRKATSEVRMRLFYFLGTFHSITYANVAFGMYELEFHKYVV